MIETTASQVQRGDEIVGWEGYVVVAWTAHPSRPGDGKITLRDTRPTTEPLSWTPKGADDPVTVLNRP